MSPFSILILIAFAVGAFGFIDKETELNFADELSSSADLSGGIVESEGKIVGGREAQRGQFPHQVSLRTVGVFGGHYCGGSILNRLFILTAANCTQGRHSVPANIRAVVGAHRISGDGIIHDVHSIYNHPVFIRMHNDVSIIRTVNEILFDTRYVRPVRLPTSNVPEAGNYAVRFSGWGRTVQGGQLATTLQFKDALTLNRPECLLRLQQLFLYTRNNTICVQNPVGRGICVGDAGGALISQSGVQVGISSWGALCALGYPDIYTNVWMHIEWIRATIKANW